MSSSRRVESVIVLLSLFSTIIGCGGPTLLPAAGTVQFDDGSPVQTGVVEFRSTDGEYRGASKISNEGAFALETLDGQSGVPAGQYDVIVVQLVITEDLSLADHNHGKPVPRKYADYFTSGLKVDVTPENASNLVVRVARQ